jgi:hypothetical protein
MDREFLLTIDPEQGMKGEFIFVPQLSKSKKKSN